MLTPGTVLRDSYIIVRLIAQGGMGAVYLAKHQRLGSTVAVKETFFDDASLLKAFEREARLLAGLRHAALPKVIDHFAEGDGWFLVMEFITGDDLAEMLKKRGSAFPISQVLDWGDQLLSALEYLHKQTPPVIHRDIKPQNLKLTEEGQVVLLDFGLAKGQAEGMSHMTAGHSIRGYTPAYAPLEQMQGAGTDARSDLYALAATLYHLMTGFTPADAFNRAAVMVTGQPDPLRPANALDPQVPQPVADLLLNAMSQDRGPRPASAAVMRRMLRDAMDNRQPTILTPVAPGLAATIPVASASQKDSYQSTIIEPPPITNHFPAQDARANNLGTPTEGVNDRLEQAPAPHLVRATVIATPLQPARKRKALLWMALSLIVIVIPLIIGMLVSVVINHRKPSTAANPSGATDSAMPLSLQSASPVMKTNSKAAGPAMEAFDFDVVTVDMYGNITSRRKGYAQYYREHLGVITLDLVEIPGGTFQMGNSDAQAEEARKEYERYGVKAADALTTSRIETPQHAVTVPTFYLGKYEVTQAQWRAVTSLPQVNRSLNPSPSKFKGDNLPVEQVSWDDAVEFCARLSKATGKNYRLPSEAEWEYACRAGTTTPFSFGEAITPDLVNYNGNYPYESVAQGLYREKTVPVGSLGMANEFGLYDMHGNVWEWCADGWHYNYISAPSDGSEWKQGADNRVRLVRGGSWRDYAVACRSAVRNVIWAYYKDKNGPYLIGLRVVSDLRTQ